MQDRHLAIFVSYLIRPVEVLYVVVVGSQSVSLGVSNDAGRPLFYGVVERLSTHACRVEGGGHSASRNAGQLSKATTQRMSRERQLIRIFPSIDQGLLQTLRQG